MKISFSKGWSTHNTMLIKTVNKSEGKVLELGAGLYSTPLLHWLCKDRNQKLVTVENNLDYYNFAKQYRSPLHRIILIKNWGDFPVREHWGVVLIDHDNSDQKRGLDALRFKDFTDYIVLHDSEKEEDYGYDMIWKHFKYRYDWKKCRPWTTVVSNFKDLAWLKNQE